MINVIKNQNDLQNIENNFIVSKVDINKLDNWLLGEDFSLKHVSNSFYTFIGIIQNSKPSFLIIQNEVGLLASLKQISSEKFLNNHYLVQKKFEPGNEPLFQISPCIQMTYSNLMGKHGGYKKDIVFFNGLSPSIIYSSLQSEESDTFLHKKNLNVLIKYSDEIFESLNVKNEIFSINTLNLSQLALKGSYIHATLRSLLFYEFLVSTLINSPYTRKFTLNSFQFFNNIGELSFLKQKPFTFSKISEISKYHKGSLILNGQEQNKISGYKIQSNISSEFKWSQPLLIIPPKIYTLIITLKSNTIYILLSKVNLPGAFTEFEISTTFIDPFTEDNISIHTNNSKELHSSWQTEEGGRFWHRKNLHKILYLNDKDTMKITDLHIWITLDDLKYMFDNGFNISSELRSISFLFFSFLISNSWKLQ